MAQAGGRRRDSHLLVASSVISLSRAATFKDFIAEVKDGHAVPFVTPNYFAPLKWKLLLECCFSSPLPANCQLQGTTGGRHAGAPQSLLDPDLGAASPRAFLNVVSALGLAR